MIKITRKIPINLTNLQECTELKQLNIPSKYIRTVLEFDGSMTKFVLNMCGGNSKPIIEVLEERQKPVGNLVQKQEKQEGKVKGQQSLIELDKIFDFGGKSPDKLIQRSIKFYVTSNELHQPKLLYFARSFWNHSKYNQIMQKNRLKPIGLNLIEQQVEIFRKLNWTGIADLQITNKQNSQVHKSLWSRSYSMISQKEPICQLQEFFIPEMFKIFF